MKALRHPATIVACVALFAALGGGVAIASGVISGKSIRNHSIPERKLTRKAIKKLRGQRGPAGPAARKDPRCNWRDRGLRGDRCHGRHGCQGRNWCHRRNRSKG